MSIVYQSEDDGTFYMETEMDLDENKEQFGYIRYEVPELISLTPKQICGHYGSLSEILAASNQLKTI